MAEKRITYKIQDLGGIGEVQIADEVVAIIAGLAATEVNGRQYHKRTGKQTWNEESFQRC